jgi:penicillin-binding protein 1A
MRSSLLDKHIHKHLHTRKGNLKKDDKKYVRKAVLLLGVFGILITALLAILGVNELVQYSFNLPSIDIPFQRNLPESTIIYDDKGNIIYTIYDSQNRIYVPLKQIPQNMKMAMLAAEDINFYSEDGIDIPAMVRSGVHDILLSNADDGLQGASTITQQLVKYTALTSNRTVERKVKEIVMTLKITQKYSKNQILEAYLNAIPFGGSNYGVEAAARAYFGKDIGQLDLAQCAFLAGLPQAPSAYSPLYSPNPDALTLAIQRQHYVLDQMLKYKSITNVTADEIESALSEPLVFNQNQGIQYPGFVLNVKSLLYQMYGSNVVNNDGLHVYTTLDPTMQNDAQQSVANGVATEVKQGFNAHNGSLVAINATNGNLLAMVGSANNNDSSPQVNGAVNMTLFPVSPGSSVKPFVYLTAFENGEDPTTQVHDVKTTFPGYPNGYTPMDFDDKFEGTIPISQALLQSRNIPAVETANKVGLAKVYDTLMLAGENIGNCDAQLSMAIGACYTSLLDHTSAYIVFPNDGVKHPVREILSVENKYGNVIYDNNKITSSYLFPADKVQEINGVLKNYDTLGPVKAKGWTVAGKTGTSQDNKNSLFMGYSSSLVVGVWCGNTDQSATSPVTYGENTAAPIWNEFMLDVLPMFPESSSF